MRKSGTVTTDADGYAHVKFGTPIKVSNYCVVLTPFASPWPYVPSIGEYTPDGFEIYTRDSRNGNAAPNVPVAWMISNIFDP
jgi:hypothetical protein